MIKIIKESNKEKAADLVALILDAVSYDYDCNDPKSLKDACDKVIDVLGDLDADEVRELDPYTGRWMDKIGAWYISDIYSCYVDANN